MGKLILINILLINELCFSIDPVTGRANLKRHDDSMKDWTEERKMLEAENLVDTLQRAMK